MLDGISSSRPGEWTGLRGGQWPCSYEVTTWSMGLVGRLENKSTDHQKALRRSHLGSGPSRGGPGEIIAVRLSLTIYTT